MVWVENVARIEESCEQGFGGERGHLEDPDAEGRIY